MPRPEPVTRPATAIAIPIAKSVVALAPPPPDLMRDTIPEHIVIEPAPSVVELDVEPGSVHDLSAAPESKAAPPTLRSSPPPLPPRKTSPPPMRAASAVVAAAAVPVPVPVPVIPALAAPPSWLAEAVAAMGKPAAAAPFPVAAPFPAAAPFPVAVPIPAAAPISAPVAVAAPISAPVPVVASPISGPVRAATTPSPAPFMGPSSAPFPPPTQKSSSPTIIPTPLPSKPRATMASLDEIVVQLFEAMFDLNFLDNSVEGGSYCLNIALEKFPSRAGFVHLFDIDTREFVVACAHGAGTESMIGRRHAGSDAMLSAAMREQNAVLFQNATATPEQMRYALLGATQSIVIAPVMDGGRFLGAIELVNPIDGAPFAERERNALTYIGERFAEFVATRGVIVDPRKIAELLAAR